MALVSMLDQLQKARVSGYALPCFDTFEMMGTVGIFAALDAKHAPGIVGLYSGALERPGGTGLAALVRTMALEASTPISLVLDHGASFEHCIKALSCGFTDVMYDGSSLPLEENIANTRLIARAAHAAGAGVEAELGHVGGGGNYQDFGGRGEGFTDPDIVVRFVEETGVDVLAVAIGTAHGVYQGTPKLDLDLLSEIASRVDIPLVLHGGSGLSDDQYQGAIHRGIAKVNIFTNLARDAAVGIMAVAREKETELGKDGLPTSGGPFLEMTRATATAFQHGCERYLDVFGASGKG